MSRLRDSLFRAMRIADPTPDALLVSRAANGDAEAIRAIVDRHGPMVLRVCRNLLADEHAAEDAFQAVFLILIRRKWRIGRPERLAAFLFGTARRTALKAKTAALRRQRRERRGHRPSPSDPFDELTARELLAGLDAELERLPEDFRLPLLLCYWQGLSHVEAARRLGWTSGSVKGRLERGRKQLSARLTKRGLAPSVLLTASATSAIVSKDLSAATLALASGIAVPAGVLALIGSGSMAKTMSALTAAVVLVGAGVFGMTTGFAAPEQVKNEQPPAPQVQPVDIQGSIRVFVLDPQGKPLPGATIHTGIWTEEKDFDRKRDYQTDATGVAEVALPKTFTILRLWASKKPFVGMFANWEQGEIAAGNGPPAEYTFRLEPAVAAGGRVVDEQGKPISGAKVQVSLAGELKPKGDGRMKYDGWLASGSDAAITDADGRWRIDSVPNVADPKLSLLVSHPDFVADEFWGDSQKAAGVTTGHLRDRTAVVALKKGLSVGGKVVDLRGQPIKDAIIILGDTPYGANQQTRFLVGADGHFRLPAMASKHTSLTAIAPGYAPQLRRLTVSGELPPQNFQLEPGKLIRISVVDQANKPLPEAPVSVEGWMGSQSLMALSDPNQPKVPNQKIPTRTDGNGIWEWESAPDTAVKLRIGQKGFAYQDIEVAGGAPTRTVMLNAEHRVSGEVTDAATGQPIAAFSVMPVDVFRKDHLHAERNNAVRGKDGRFTYLARRTDIPIRLRVEARGYRSQDGPEFRIGDAFSLKQSFRLQPSAPISGVVQDSDGRPANNVLVTLATPTEGAMLRFDEPNNDQRTDSAGRFEFPDPGERFMIIARSNAGFAMSAFAPGTHDAGTVRLLPWATISGQFLDDGQPVAGASIMLRPIELWRPGEISVDMTQECKSKPDGSFAFDRVLPVPSAISALIGPWKDEGFRSSPIIPLDLQPGQKVALDLGGAGATLTGKVKLSGKVPPDLDCTYAVNLLVRREPGIALPAGIGHLGFDARQGWRDVWRKSAEGQVYLSTLHSWFVKLAPDGSFRISGVPAGDYDLAVAVYAKPSGGCLTDPLARAVARVTVSEADVARGAVTVPEIRAEVAPVPEVGEAPSLNFVRPDGAAAKLADVQGKYTLVHFWASWCVPCKHQMPAVRELHARFGEKGIAFVGLSLDEDADAWRRAVTSLDLPWQQGRLSAGSDAGVSSVPAYWLLDPAGKLIARSYDLDEVAKVLRERVR